MQPNRFLIPTNKRNRLGVVSRILQHDFHESEMDHPKDLFNVVGFAHGNVSFEPGYLT